MSFVGEYDRDIHVTLCNLQANMTEIFRYNDPSKGDMELVEVEGFTFVADGVKLFFKDKTLKEQIEDVKSLAIRDDDMFVCAFAKCGKELVQLLYHLIVTGVVLTFVILV